MFCGLAALEELYLGDNQLQGVEFDFSCLKNLTHLSLEYNKIKRIPNAILKQFDKVFGRGTRHPSAKHLNLKGNPFRCDCHLTNLASWLERTEVKFYHKVKRNIFFRQKIMFRLFRRSSDATMGPRLRIPERE